MSTTNFEQRLVALYDAAKAAKAAALTRLQKAKMAAGKVEDKAEAEATCAAAERAYSAAVTDADANLNAGRAALRAEVKADIHARSLANPDDVIPSAITLLDSDIMTADDLLALADLYSDNFTMIRLIMPRARQAMCTANTTRDHAERDALDQVIDKCLGYLNADLIAFDRLDTKLAGEQVD